MKKITANLDRRQYNIEYRLEVSAYQIDEDMAVCHAIFQQDNIANLSMPQSSSRYWYLFHIKSGRTDGQYYASRKEAIDHYHEEGWNAKIHEAISKIDFNVCDLPEYRTVLPSIFEQWKAIHG